MSVTTIKDNSKLLKDLIKQITKKSITIGYTSEPEIKAVELKEYGDPIHNIPATPFMEHSVQESLNDDKAIVENGLKNVLQLNTLPESILNDTLNKVGENIQSHINANVDLEVLKDPKYTIN